MITDALAERRQPWKSTRRGIPGLVVSVPLEGAMDA